LPIKKFRKINHYEKIQNKNSRESIQVSLCGEFFIQREKKKQYKKGRRSQHKCTTKNTHRITKTEQSIA